MRADDLEQFAVADGLLVRLTAEPGHLSEAEKNYLLFQAARALALAADLKGEEAYRLIYPMTPEPDDHPGRCRIRRRHRLGAHPVHHPPQ